ncbi:MAG TPA: dockerin type I domain-containing protein, partial [Herpetosiphonaceae bacterium]|nr:dockerin type I domain-containing protein [Herpetosiphonaceae bacterium]
AGTAKAVGKGSLGELTLWRDYQDCIDNLVSDLLGYLDIDICGPEYPQFLGWAVGDSGASRYFSHELAHMMGLVPEGAANYARYPGAGGDSHSGSSELNNADGNPAACSEDVKTFTMTRSIYRRSGVSEPIVNPISGNQLLPQSTGNQDTDRAKALLSYACARTETNSFLEPTDINYLVAERFSALRPFYGANRRASQALPAVDERERLNVTGLINTTEAGVTGSIAHVELKPNSVPLSADYISGYELVEYDAAGAELLRQGVFPVGDHHTTPHESDDGDAHGSAAIFFANLPRAAGVARLDLVREGAVLATWSGGAAAPGVSITSPTGGESVTDELAVSWEASDPDGDALAVSIQFSRDDGATWTPVASATGSGSATVPAELLAGGASARVRVWVSDGLNQASATSAAFSVAGQAPEVFISSRDGATLLEGAPVALRGQADDPQDGRLADDRLTWSSDRDGELGGGAALNTTLSAGQHTITLRATNGAGLSGSASLTVVVQADYDGDGLLDSEEAALGFNPLASADALGDSDGDGLLWRTERGRGTDPDLADSDGDGRSDSAELADNSDPLVGDEAAPDLLQVWPLSMTFDVDLAVDGQLPQQLVEAFSRSGAAVTLSSDVPWLDLSATAGPTPFVGTVVLNPILLAAGTQRGTITVSSSLGDVAVPITVNVSNKADFCDVDGSGSGDAADVAAVQARVGSGLGDANYAVRFDVDRDGEITAADVQLLGGCVGVAAPGWSVYMPFVAR